MEINHLFLSFTAVFEQANRARHIITGVSETDFNGCSDCRETSIKLPNVTLYLARNLSLSFIRRFCGGSKSRFENLQSAKSLMELYEQFIDRINQNYQIS